MDIFLSWSGERSKAVALALRDWLPGVIQGCAPWMSEADIKAGQQWHREIGGKLDTSTFGIICITPENTESAWLNFEAGAISKRIDAKESRVAGYLFDLAPGQFEGPLIGFQLKQATENGTYGVIESINGLLPTPLPGPQLKKTFDKWWPDLRQQLEAIKTPHGGKPAKRDPDDMLEEVVEATRRIEKALSALGARPPIGRTLTLADLSDGALVKTLLTGEVADASWSPERLATAKALMDAMQTKPSATIAKDPTAQGVGGDDQKPLTRMVIGPPTLRGGKK